MRHLHKVGLYAPYEVFEKYYKSFSTHFDWTVVRDYKQGIISDDVVSMMIYMVLNGDNNFSHQNILYNLENQKKLFYDCKIYTSPVSMTKLIIDSKKILGYDVVSTKFGFGKFKFMDWVAIWCEKQDIGSEVFLFDGRYEARIKFYLLTSGYDETYPNTFIKVSNPLKAKFVLL